MKAIVSPNVRIRHPADFVVGDGSVVDDFCYFSTRVRIGVCSHVANGCSIAGGQQHLFVLGDYSSLSAGVKIWCASDDFVNDLVAMLPSGVGDIKQHTVQGDVTFGNCTAVGSNTVVMPGNVIPEGTVIGAMSLVPARYDFEPWSVYAGIPIKLVGTRNKAAVVAQAELLKTRLQSLRTEG